VLVLIDRLYIFEISLAFSKSFVLQTMFFSFYEFYGRHSTRYSDKLSK